VRIATVSPGSNSNDTGIAVISQNDVVFPSALPNYNLRISSV
jgi:hypothetical protein